VLMLSDLTQTGRRQRDWLDLAAALQQRGCTVLSLDFRGYGENLQSQETVPNSFIGVPANNLLRVESDAVAPVERQPQTPDDESARGSTVFTEQYLPWLVQDVIAARLWLDLKHDAGEVNTNNLILLAEGDAAALGMVWLATESFRYKDGTNEKEYELRDLYGAVWLEPHLTLRGRSLAGLKSVQTTLNSRDRWPPMLTAYDRAGGGVKTARDWSKLFKQDGRLGGERGLTRGRLNFGERTLLMADGGVRTVTEYVEDMTKERPLRAWTKRDVEASAYSWDLGSGRSSPAKAAKASRPALAPLNNWGFVGLRIQ